MRFAFVFLSLVALCGCGEGHPFGSSKKYWLIDINDGGIVTTSDGETDLKSHVRMLVRGTYEGETAEGTWDFAIDQYTFMDLTENVQEENIQEGYYSGKNYYTSVGIELNKYTLPIFNDELKYSYYFGSKAQKLPYFKTSQGKYQVKVLGDDGNLYEQSGNQLFMTCFPENLKIELAGSSKDDLSTVQITFNMVSVDGISNTNLDVSGSIYQFDTKEKRDEWMENHPYNDYLLDPKTIPFK